MSREELEKKMIENQDLFDSSNYPEDHSILSNVNKQVVGKMKNEVAGTDIKDFCGLRPKSYAYTTFDNSVTKRAKGVKRQILKNEIAYNDYKDVVLNPGTRILKDFNNIESLRHEITTAEKRKLELSAFDDKRFILDNGVKKRAHGHYKNIFSNDI